MRNTEKTDKGSVVIEVKQIFGQLLGIEWEQIDSQSTFLSIGADSLLLLQASQRLQSAFGVKVPFRALLEEYATFAQLAAFLEEQAPDRTAAVPVESEKPSAPETILVQETYRSISNPSPVPPVAREVDHYSAENVLTARSEVEQIVRQQLHIMKQQLAVLQSLPLSAPVTEVPPQAPAAQIASEAPAVTHTESSSHNEQARSLHIDSETYVPYQSRRVGRLSGLTEQQTQHVEALIERYAKRTAKSKQSAQESRRYHADNRGTDFETTDI